MEKEEINAQTPQPEKTKFTEKHSGIWTFIKFTLMSSIAGVTEGLTCLLLDSVILREMNSVPFHFWIFNYDGDGISGKGTMIAFLVSSIVGNIISFTTNRKATFKANNNVAFSAILYFAMIVVIICLQTWLGPVIKGAIGGYLPDAVSNLAAKGILAFGSFLVLFPINKYVIMKRN